VRVLGVGSYELKQQQGRLIRIVIVDYDNQRPILATFLSNVATY
jgi:hypothetical protein